MSNTPKLAERLAELKEEKNLSSPQLAEILGLSTPTINRFLRGTRTPCFSCLIKLLNFFNCSADYLLGRENIPHDEVFQEALPFHLRLRQILKEYGVSQEKLKRDLNVSSSVVYKWVSGKSQPSIHTLAILADYFDCSIDFLIGRVR